MCSKCWSALQEFHKYYCEIEAVRQQHEHELLAIGDKQQEEVTVVCDSLEPSYRTEFFEVKVEPFEQTDVFEQENSNCSDEKPLHCAFVKCEEPPIDLDPTAPSSDEDSEVPQGSRSDSSSPDRRKPKRERNPKRPQTSDTETKQSKATAQKEEDERVFKSKHNLNAHLANVCTERSFPCPICAKQFKKKIKLTEHMTTHTKSVLYQCPYCPKTFSFETQLYTHRKQAHYEQWLEMQRKRKEGVRFKVNRITDMPST